MGKLFYPRQRSRYDFRRFHELITDAGKAFRARFSVSSALSSVFLFRFTKIIITLQRIGSLLLPSEGEND